MVLDRRPATVFAEAFSKDGKGIVVRPTYDPKVEEFIRPLFQQYYTMSFDNYPVEMERIEHPDIRPCQESGVRGQESAKMETYPNAKPRAAKPDS